MEISYKVSSYLSATFLKRDLEGPEKVKGAADASEEKAQTAVSGEDKVEISAQGRALQHLLSAREEERQQDNGEGKNQLLPKGSDAQGGGNAADDTTQRIQELQEQLRSAMTRLNQARKELSDAQSKSVEEVKALQNGENPDAMLGSGQQQAEQERDAAQQKVVSAQAEVNTIQEQLQKMLREKAKDAQKLASPSPDVGQVWEPMGTNDYIAGNS